MRSCNESCKAICHVGRHAGDLKILVQHVGSESVLLQYAVNMLGLRRVMFVLGGGENANTMWQRTAVADDTTLSTRSPKAMDSSAAPRNCQKSCSKRVVTRSISP